MDDEGIPERGEVWARVELGLRCVCAHTYPRGAHGVCWEVDTEGTRGLEGQSHPKQRF